jgi:hypothetical protein
MDKLKKLAADHEMEFGKVDENVLVRRLENAYEIIKGALLTRGLTVIQISTWARGEEFQLDLATYWYAKDCGWGAKEKDEVDWTTVFNREEELMTVPLVSNDDVLMGPGKGTVASGMQLLDINADLGIDY